MTNISKFSLQLSIESTEAERHLYNSKTQSTKKFNLHLLDPLFSDIHTETPFLGLRAKQGIEHPLDFLEKFQDQNYTMTLRREFLRIFATRLTGTYLQHNFDVVTISFAFLVSLKPASTVQQRLCQTRLFRARRKGIQGNFPRHLLA